MALSVSFDLVSSSARVTSVKSNQTLLTHGHPDPTIGPQVYLGPIKRCGHIEGLADKRPLSRDSLIYISEIEDTMSPHGVTNLLKCHMETSWSATLAHIERRCTASSCFLPIHVIPIESYNCFVIPAME